MSKEANRLFEIHLIGDHYYYERKPFLECCSRLMELGLSKEDAEGYLAIMGASRGSQ